MCRSFAIHDERFVLLSSYFCHVKYHNDVRPTWCGCDGTVNFGWQYPCSAHIPPMGFITSCILLILSAPCFWLSMTIDSHSHGMHPIFNHQWTWIFLPGFCCGTTMWYKSVNSVWDVIFIDIPLFQLDLTQFMRFRSLVLLLCLLGWCCMEPMERTSKAKNQMKYIIQRMGRYNKVKSQGYDFVVRCYHASFVKFVLIN